MVYNAKARNCKPGAYIFGGSSHLEQVNMRQSRQHVNKSAIASLMQHRSAWRLSAAHGRLAAQVEKEGKAQTKVRSLASVRGNHGKSLYTVLYAYHTCICQAVAPEQ